MKTQAAYQSLYFKIAASFAVAIIAVSLAQLYLVSSGYERLVSNINQSIAWDSASFIANRIQPELLDQTLEPEDFNRLLLPYREIDPKLEFYILRADGSVFAFHNLHKRLLQTTVNLAPIQEALKDISPRLPLYGDNPEDPESEHGTFLLPSHGSVFSVAPLFFNGQKGYLYIVIEGARFTKLIRQIGLFFIARTLGMGWMLITLGTILLGFLLFRFLTRKLNVITEAIERYEAGDYSQPIPATSEDEIGILSRSLNTMAKRLIEAKDAVAEQDRQRRTLIAKISHDLRSPLQRTMGNLEIALEQKNQLQDAKLRERLQSAL